MQMFDSLLLLAPEGRLLYCGPYNQTVKYFSTTGHVCPAEYNPADYFMDLMQTSSNTVLADLAEKFMASKINKENEYSLPLEGSNGSVELTNIPPKQHTEDVIMEHALYSHAEEGTKIEYTPKADSLQQSEVSDSEFKKSSSEIIILDSSYDDTQNDFLTSNYQLSGWSQFVLLSERNLKNIFRNRYLFLVHVITTIIIAVFIGGLYYQLPATIAGVQDRYGSLFFAVSLFIFSSITSLDIFISETILYNHEKSNGSYRTSSYFFAKVLSDLFPMRIIPPMIYVAITYFMIGYVNSSTKFLIQLVFLIEVNVSAAAFCTFIAAIVPSVAVGNFVGVIVMLFMMLFGGFLVNGDQMPVVLGWIRYTSFFYFGYEGMILNELTDLYVLVNVQGIAPTTVTGTIFLTALGFGLNNLYRDLIALVIEIIVFFFLAYIVLFIKKIKY